jgi:hypothetical protein
MNFFRDIPELFKILKTITPTFEKNFIPSGFLGGAFLSLSNIATIFGALAAIATFILACYRIRMAHLELKEKQQELGNSDKN